METLGVAPVLDHFGQALAAITITAVVRPGEDAPNNLIPALLEACAAMSQAIGGGVAAGSSATASGRARRVSA